MFNNIVVSEFNIPYRDTFGKSINFNPSILHLKDNYFLLSTHVYKREKDVPPNTIVHANTNDPYHMYFGGYNSSTWWSEGPNGFRGTAFFIIKIFNHTITVVKSIAYNHYGVDARLAHTTQGMVATLTDTTFVDERGSERTHYNLNACVSYNLEDRTMLLLPINVYVKTASTIYVNIPEKPGTILCPRLQYLEKNWSLWTYDNQLYISNYLVPQHIVFVPKYGNYDDCYVITSDTYSLYEYIERYYDRHVIFSLSAPAIPYNDLMIGVGHIKITENVSKYTPAYYATQNNRPKHPCQNTTYMMFLYTFDPETLEIIESSPAFIPPETEHSVVFPCGFIYFDNNYIISYGEGDVKMKLMFIPYNNVKNLLRPVDNFTEEYEFIEL